MESHHFVGHGSASDLFVSLSAHPDSLVDEIEREILGTGMVVVDRRLVAFTPTGTTIVWILAESHLALHYWPEDHYVTFDLHVCSYERSNLQASERLQTILATKYLQKATRDSWHSFSMSWDPRESRGVIRVHE